MRIGCPPGPLCLSTYKTSVLQITKYVPDYRLVSVADHVLLAPKAIGRYAGRL